LPFGHSRPDLPLSVIHRLSTARDSRSPSGHRLSQVWSARNDACVSGTGRVVRSQEEGAMWISGQGVWITAQGWGKCPEQRPILWGWLVDGRWDSDGLCVDWHTPGPSGIGVAGEMWTGYPHPVRHQIRTIPHDFGVIPALPTTTAKTRSPSIRKNETCGRR
jgi:hypothetical protein